MYRDEMQKCRGKHDGGVSGGWSIMAGSGNPATELHPRSGNLTNCGASSRIGQSRNGASSDISADMRDGRGDMGVWQLCFPSPVMLRGSAGGEMDRESD